MPVCRWPQPPGRRLSYCLPGQGWRLWAHGPALLRLRAWRLTLAGGALLSLHPHKALGEPGGQWACEQSTQACQPATPALTPHRGVSSWPVAMSLQVTERGPNFLLGVML